MFFSRVIVVLVVVGGQNGSTNYPYRLQAYVRQNGVAIQLVLRYLAAMNRFGPWAALVVIAAKLR